MNKKICLIILLVIISFLPFCAWGTDMGIIESGEVHTGTLISPDTDTWQFYGDAGDRVIITARGSGVQPEIFLNPPDSGPCEASQTGSAYNKTLYHQLLQSGFYTIVVSDWYLDGTGDYGIALVKIPGAATSPSDTDGGGIASGETLAGAMNSVADTDIFQFYGDAGDRVIITARGSGMQPEVFLFPPDSGPCEALETGAAYDKTLDHQLLQSGLYSIVISDWYLDSTGDYGIDLVKVPDDLGIGIYNPYPENGATIYDSNDSFSWDSVAGATGYDLYFGEDIVEPLEKIGDNLSSPSMQFPAMTRGKVYYWHVAAKTAGGDIQGPYWWFKAQYRVSMPWLLLLMDDVGGN